MINYNVTAEIEGKLNDGLVLHLLDQLVDFHPTARRTVSGEVEIDLTLSANNSNHANAAARIVLGAVGQVANAIRIVPTVQSTRRLGGLELVQNRYETDLPHGEN